ncbi:major facilitator superfamily domain-containing protein [Blakeslea trispora]|nr:major facilitator superfamily domain-containing protein [Blakeslea trispora]
MATPDEKLVLDTNEKHEQETFKEEDKSVEIVADGGDTSLANAPWQYKVIALITALLFPFGTHFSMSALSAMKKEVVANLAITNTQYGVISASVSIINTLFPIAGGIFIDLFGSVWGTLATNFVIVLGALLTAISAKYKSYALMIVSRVIFGVGSGLIVTMQQSLLSKWFRTRHLSIAIGLQLSVGRLSKFLGTLVANSIAKTTGDWVWAFWLSFILCCFSIIMNFIYAFVVHRLQGRATLSASEKEALKKKKTFKIRSVFKFPFIFWHVILIEFIYAAIWASFQTIATDLVSKHFGASSVLAGYKASVSQAVPIVATPVLGLFMEFYGCRVMVLSVSAIFLMISAGLLGWTYVDAVIGMALYSISLAFGLVSMVTSVGMVLPSDYIGTGFGIYKSANNIGQSILDVVIGVVQDKTAGQSYINVMLTFLVMAGIGFIAILLLWFNQYYFHGNLLEMGRAKRAIRMQEISDKELELTSKGQDSLANTPYKKLNFVWFAIFVSALLTAWVLFFVYSVSGHA